MLNDNMMNLENGSRKSSNLSLRLENGVFNTFNLLLFSIEQFGFFYQILLKDGSLITFLSKKQY